jgi:hypothetical protein
LTFVSDFDNQFTPVDSNKLRLVLFDENTSDRFKNAKKPEFLNNLYFNYNAADDQADGTTISELTLQYSDIFKNLAVFRFFL